MATKKPAKKKAAPKKAVKDLTPKKAVKAGATGGMGAGKVFFRDFT